MGRPTERSSYRPPPRPAPGPLSSSVVREVAQGFAVTDLDTAIFIYLRALDDTSLGISVLEAVKLGPAQHDVIFSGEYRTSRQLELEFINGFRVPAIKWCSAQRSLKKIIRRFTDAGRGQRRAEQR